MKIRDKEITLIAEVKISSPFGYRSEKNWDELFGLANKYGDIISVHTDSRWEGSFELLAKARQMTSKPILAKGIHATDEGIKRAIDLGADLVLVVGRVPADTSLWSKVLFEQNNLAELAASPAGVKVVWNSRDLATGGLKIETFAQARKVWPGWLCQASNIKTVADVELSADAILVGTKLEEFIKSL